MNRTQTILPLPNNGKNLLLTWAQSFEHVIWLDSNESTSNQIEGIIAIEVHSQIKSDYFNAFNQLITYTNKINDYLFGYLGYDLKNDVENTLHSNNVDFLKFDDLFFFQPKKIIEIKNNQFIFKYLDIYKEDIFSDYENICQQITNSTFKNILTIEPRISKETYLQKVEQIKEQIHLGNIYEMNFCQEFYAKEAHINPLATYLQLNQISTAPFSCFIKQENQYLLCASPERFLKKSDLQVISQPIKGTAKRGLNNLEDLEQQTNLKNNPKEIAENVMIVDLVRNDLSHIAERGTVHVPELCKIYTFKQVHQMISTISCKVKKDISIIEIIKNCFPMGSMTGAPKIAAMKIIEQLEESKRGLYSGAVGYITPEKDFDFNVVIRSILYNQKQQYVSYTVGSAITAKSDAALEYEECLVKANAMKQVLTQ